MEGSSTQRKPGSPAENNRSLECHHCGCRHFRVIYSCPPSVGRWARRGWGGKLIRRREPVRRLVPRSLGEAGSPHGEGGCRQCGKSPRDPFGAHDNVGAAGRGVSRSGRQARTGRRNCVLCRNRITRMGPGQE